jgi:hypothetical protein
MSKLTNPTLTHPELWGKISAHSVESNQPRFISKLCVHYLWSADFARCAYQEYLRFCYLVAARLTANPLSPSHSVDQVWHLHLIHTRDYWRVFCPNALGIELHHTPSDGSAHHHLKMREQYAQTLKLYEAEFGTLHELFWPGLVEQFQPRQLICIDPQEHWIVARPWRRTPYLLG